MNEENEYPDGKGREKNGWMIDGWKEEKGRKNVGKGRREGGTDFRPLFYIKPKIIYRCIKMKYKIQNYRIWK